MVEFSQPYFEVTLLVTGALEKLEISYMVVGSLAMSAHGVVRGTRDSDIVAGLRPGDGSRIASQLGPDFYLDVQTAEEAIRRRSSFGAVYLPQVFKIDVFALGSRSYDLEAFRRRTTVDLGAQGSICVETPEDVVLSKLRWYRLGGEVSELQWRDVLGVLKLQAGRLDADYLRRWAAEERITDLFDRALQEAR